MLAKHPDLRWPAAAMAVALAEICASGLPLDAAEYPYPGNGDVNTPQSLILSWSVGEGTAFHDIYFGRDANAVADASPATAGIYQGRLACDPSRFDPDLQVWRVYDRSRFDPGPLDWNTPYFWRIDEVNEVNPVSPVKGEVWRFTTADFLVIDDFESYDDDERRIYNIWIDGWWTGNGSIVGYTMTPFAKEIIYHSGRQCMPFSYDNSEPPHYSEAYRAWETPQDWTVRGGTDLSLWVYGWPLAFEEKQDGTIVLSGDGVWDDKTEGFVYAHKELTGDGSIVARVGSLENTDDWARAGVMIREKTKSWSSSEPRFIALAVTPAHGVVFASSLVAGQDRQESSIAKAQTPCWLKLARAGRTFTALHSGDGVTWREIHDANDRPVMVDLDVPQTVEIGLFTASNKSRVPTRAEFTDVAFTGDVPEPWDTEAIIAKTGYNVPAPLYVALEDAAGTLATAFHPDPAAVNIPGWTQWRIPLDEFAAVGVDVRMIARMYLGLGSRNKPQSGGDGMIYIDDIAVVRSATAETGDVTGP